MGKVEPLLELTTLLKAERAESFWGLFHEQKLCQVSDKFKEILLDCLQSMSVIQAPVVWEKSLHK